MCSPTHEIHGESHVALPARKPTIDTCNACGKLFPRLGIQLCTACAIVDENRFRLVRDYLVEHDGAPLAEIARETGVPTSDVRRFADGGRLVEITAGMDSCTCGGVGTRCRFCRSKLSQSFRRVEREMRQEHDAAAVDDGARTSYVRRIRRLGE
jgi:hypothetical protein